MPRLFAGLEIPAHVTSVLSGLRGGLSGARWIEPSDYHITLRFIGDIGFRLAQDIDSLLADVQRLPLDIRISGLDVFGGDRPHALIATVEPNRPLMELQSEVERLIRACGLEIDRRRFQPHVTLARLRNVSSLDVADYLSVRGYFPAQQFTAERFVLYSARDSVGGGPYLVETAYPLLQPAWTGRLAHASR
jgi:RNA 2',3'-cyclic 3'-phosphodiesterase